MPQLEAVFEGAVCIPSPELDLGHRVQRVCRRDLSGQRQQSLCLLTVFHHIVLEHRSDSVHRLEFLHGGAVCVSTTDLDIQHSMCRLWYWDLFRQSEQGVKLPDLSRREVSVSHGRVVLQRPRSMCSWSENVTDWHENPPIFVRELREPLDHACWHADCMQQLCGRVLLRYFVRWRREVHDLRVQGGGYVHQLSDRDERQTAMHVLHRDAGGELLCGGQRARWHV